MYWNFLLFCQLLFVLALTEDDGKTKTSFSIKVDDIKREPIMTVTDKNFDTITRKGYTFIKFYAPWCGHCQEMAYDWDKLGESNRDKPLPGVDLTIGEVDCVDNALLCLKQGVDSYPTIKLYSSDGSVEDYLYARVLLRMQRYLVDKLIDINLLPSNSIGTVTLNDYTFQKFIETNKNVVVKFFTTWCPHCVNFKETFDEVVIKFLMEESEDVKFAEVDCMDMDSLEVCSDENVEGFPAVYLYKEGIIEDIFTDERTTQNLENFVWTTVDPSRVEEEMDPFLSLMGMMGGGVGDDAEDLDEEEEDEEEEDCDCSEPDCDCGDDDEEEGEDEEVEEEENEGEEEIVEEAEDSADSDGKASDPGTIGEDNSESVKSEEENEEKGEEKGEEKLKEETSTKDEL